MFDLLTPMVPLPVTLCNEVVTLEPIEPRHAPDLQAALDDRVFEYMPMRSSVKTPNEVRRYVDFQQRRAETIAFAVIDNSSGAAIGSTSFMNIRAEHRGLEIGSTWITKSARGTRVNPAMKHLMLSHAFDGLGAVRVELKTDARNLRSRSAILKLGAQFEGLMRAHMIMPDGALRDSAVYSITREDWAGVERGLLARLGA
ncbi:MAG: GNAT family N-acetyltransferase [Phycisphaerales bacterium JB052]